MATGPKLFSEYKRESKKQRPPKVTNNSKEMNPGFQTKKEQLTQCKQFDIYYFLYVFKDALHHYLRDHKTISFHLIL